MKMLDNKTWASKKRCQCDSCWWYIYNGLAHTKTAMFTVGPKIFFSMFSTMLIGNTYVVISKFDAKTKKLKQTIEIMLFWKHATAS